MDSTVPADLLKLLRHEVALITVKTARAGLHPLLHQRFSVFLRRPGLRWIMAPTLIFLAGIVCIPMRAFAQ